MGLLRMAAVPGLLRMHGGSCAWQLRQPSLPAPLAGPPARRAPLPLRPPPPRSRRADPLAAWTNGLDLAAVVADTDRAFLILETGFNQRWRCGTCSPVLGGAALRSPCCLPAGRGAARRRPVQSRLGIAPHLIACRCLVCRYGAYRRTLETTAEATAWEQAKQAVGCALHCSAALYCSSPCAAPPAR